MSAVALVTGGGGGIGAAVCGSLARRGYRVLVVDVDADAASEVAESFGGTAFAADVRDPEQNRAMVAHATQTFGRLDLTVLNAGIASGQSPGEPLSTGKYRAVTGVNLDGVVFGIDAAVPALAQWHGTIVVNASVAGLAPDADNPLYAMTKAAGIAYARGMAPTLAALGVRILAVCPSLTDTAILGALNRRFLVRQKFPLLTADEVAAALTTVLDEAGSGEVWTVVAGQPPTRYDFPALPPTRYPDGTEAVFRPFLAPKSR